MESTEQISKCSIQLLPIELFVMALDEFIPKSHNRRELVTVINLSSVCRNWRRVILNTPAFWTYVVLNPSFNERHYPAHLKLQLQRTGTALLHVNWYLSGQVYPGVMEIIYAYAPLERWRSLSLYISTIRSDIDWRLGAAITYGPASFPQLLGRFDNLEGLSLYGDITLAPQFVELVEGSALQLRRLEASLPLLREKFPRTLRRIRMHASGLPSEKIPVPPSTTPFKELIVSDTPAASTSADSSRKWYHGIPVWF